MRDTMFDVETKLTNVSDNTLEGFVQKVQSLLGEKKKIVCMAAIVAICEESSSAPAPSASVESSQLRSDILQATGP